MRLRVSVMAITRVMNASSFDVPTAGAEVGADDVGLPVFMIQPVCQFPIASATPTAYTTAALRAPDMRPSRPKWPAEPVF